jgi:REP element-mobilizing transposase RayT
MSHDLFYSHATFSENFRGLISLTAFMILVTWRLMGTLRQRPHCMTVTAVDRLLDRDMAEPHLLGQSAYARLVKQAILRHEGALYRLHAWVVMKNHVHLLIEPKAEVAEIGRIIMDETEARTQRRIWVRESYERAVGAEFAQIIHWIENHPVRARLVERPEQWDWSSARAEHVRKPVKRAGSADRDRSGLAVQPITA